MISQWQHSKMLDFTGGENKQIVPERIAPNQVRTAQNCIITDDGLLQTRTGKRLINETSLGSGKIISLHEYSKENGITYLVAHHGTSLYAAEWDGTSAITSWTTIKTGLNQNSILRSVTWRDNLILTNGVNNPFRFDGSTCTDLSGTPPLSTIIAVYAGKLWLTDVTQPNWVRFSAIEDYDSWDALDVLYIRDGDGDFITSLTPVQGGLLICKRTSIFALYGYAREDFSVSQTPIVEGVGVMGFDAMDQTNQIFVSKSGIYRAGLSGVEKFSNTHDDVIATTADETVITAFSQKEQRLLIILSSNTILNVELKHGAITSFEGLNIGAATSSDNSSGTQGIVIGDVTNGYIYTLDNTTDDAGTPINTRIWTAYLYGQIVRQKVWRMYQPDFNAISAFASDIQILWDVDFTREQGSETKVSSGLTSFKWGQHWNEYNWGPVGRFSPKVWMHHVQGDNISFGISCTDRIKFLGHTIKFREIGAI